MRWGLHNAVHRKPVPRPAPSPAPLSPRLPQGQPVHFMNTSVTLQVFLLIVTGRDSRFSLLGRELLSTFLCKWFWDLCFYFF